MAPPVVDGETRALQLQGGESCSDEDVETGVQVLSTFSACNTKRVVSIAVAVMLGCSCVVGLVLRLGASAPNQSHASVVRELPDGVEQMPDPTKPHKMCWPLPTLPAAPSEEDMQLVNGIPKKLAELQVPKDQPGSLVTQPPFAEDMLKKIKMLVRDSLKTTTPKPFGALPGISDKIESEVPTTVSSAAAIAASGPTASAVAPAAGGSTGWAATPANPAAAYMPTVFPEVEEALIANQVPRNLAASTTTVTTCVTMPAVGGLQSFNGMPPATGFHGVAPATVKIGSVVATPKLGSAFPGTSQYVQGG